MRRVTREDALARLPPAYALALRLRDTGLADAAIAERVGVEPEALGALFTLAEAKLAALLGRPQEPE